MTRRLWLMLEVAVAALAMNASGQAAAPPWAGSRVGHSDGVPKPWTPVRVNGNVVRCWGREYRWGVLPFPSQVTTQGRPVLAGPVRMRAMVAGQEVVWKPVGRLAPARLSLTTGAAAQIAREAQGDGLRLKGTATIEFDGMIRIDFSLSATKPVQVESFLIEIPYRPECAALFHYWPLHEQDNYIASSGATPSVPMSSDFRPLWWLGNEGGGLCWFAESDEGWEPADLKQVQRAKEAVHFPLKLGGHPPEEPKRALEILPRQGETTLALHVWDIPRNISRPQKFTMGLQATPVKPWPTNWHKVHISGNAHYGWEVHRLEGLNWYEYQEKMGVNVMCFGMNWSDIDNYPRVYDPEAFKRMIAEAHSRGMRFVPYFGYEISDIAPEFPLYGEECRVLPMSRVYFFNVTPGYEPMIMPQKGYAVCYRSHWADFIIEAMDRIKRDYGIDGVYLDGTASPWHCANELHGCGYVAKDGSRKPTFPIFAVRDLMKRINALFAQEPDGIVIVHNSTCNMMATLSFATCCMDGENICNMPRKESPLQTLSLEAFRAEFMGHNWGIPQVMLQSPAVITTEELLSISLLHDVIPRTDLTPPGLKTISSFWRILEDFGVDEAEWFPYWRNAKYVETSHSADIKVSFYLRKRKGALLVASNLGRQDTGDAWVRLRHPGLPVGQRCRATDAMTGEHLVMQGDVVKLSLRKWRPRLILIRPLGEGLGRPK